MSDLERLRLDAFVRAVEQHYGRALTSEELERLAKRLAENRPFEWMRAFVDRQGTKMPDFNAMYQRKAELDGESHDPRP